MRAAASAAAAAAALAMAAPAEAALRFERCGPFAFQCARMSVPLDRSGAVPGRVSLFVKRVRARQRPRRGALFVLAGGPGQSATSAFGEEALSLLYPAYRRRDLVILDQRGTGRSGLLRCRALERANLLDAGRAAARCAARLGARRGFYTSRDSVEDIEAVRRELGYERIALYGTSYGTKVALGYALGHPANVERLVLDSVVEADGPDALYLDTLEAIPRALRSLCRSGCSAFTRDPVADLRQLVSRLARSPLRGRVVDRHGRARPERIDRGDLFVVLVAGDHSPVLRAAFPGAVRAALEGDPAPLLRLRSRAFDVEGEPAPPRLLSSMLYAATTCEETRFPWARDGAPDEAARRAEAESAVAGIPDTAFLPFDRATALANDQIELCARWPAAPVPPDFGPGPLPDVPVLLFEGEDDLRTPLENARRVAAQFSRARVVVAPETGHSALGADPGGCTIVAFGRFMEGKPFSSRCPRRPRVFSPLPPPPARLAAVRRAPGVPGARGRVLTALALTLRDVGDDALTELIADPRDPDLARGGGLRAGTYRIDSDGALRLRRLAFVPGVRLSGRIRAFGRPSRQHGLVRVQGAAGLPDGVITLRRQRLSGVLSGRPVAGRLGPVLAAAKIRAASRPRLRDRAPG